MNWKAFGEKDMDILLATSKNIVTKIYSIRRPLNQLILKIPGEDARRFIEFLRSKQGQGINGSIL
jgi:hypothetical protein